jgi:WD40 repeat protein
LWDTETGKQRALVAEKGPIFDLAYAPDGRTLATAGRQDGVKLWDVPGPMLVERCTLRSGGRPATILVYSPDGRTLATGGNDRVLQLWDTSDPRRAPRVFDAEDVVFCAAFTPDGKTLVGGRETLTIWDVATGKTRVVSDQQVRLIRAVTFAPDGKTLFTASFQDPALSARDTATWEVSRTQSLSGRSALSAVLSPDGKSLAVGIASPGGESRLALVDAATFEPRAAVAMVEQAVGALAFSPDGKMLAASTLGDEGRQVILCEAVSGREIRHLRLPAPANGLAFAPDSKSLAVGTRDGTIILFDPGNGSTRGSFAAHASQITRLAYAPDGRTLVSAEIEGTIKFWWVGK